VHPATNASAPAMAEIEADGCDLGVEGANQVCGQVAAHIAAEDSASVDKRTAIMRVIGLSNERLGFR
jgi:hypothetical protein